MEKKLLNTIYEHSTRNKINLVEYLRGITEQQYTRKELILCMLGEKNTDLEKIIKEKMEVEK